MMCTDKSCIAMYNLTTVPSPNWNKSESTLPSTNDTGGMLASGPMSLKSQTGLVVLFSSTTLLAIVGNCFVVLVFARGRRSRTDLRPFLVNLAIADLFMAVFCMPFTFIYTMLEDWVFSKPMCPIVLFVQMLSVSASVFTNMAIGTDRFLAVMFPLRSRLTTKKAKYVITGIWISSLALSSVQFKVGHATEHPTGQVSCEETWSTEAERKTYTLALFVITYLIPLIILTITYSIIGVLLWKRISPGNRDYARDMQQLRSKRKVVKMLVIVVTMFGVCWLPLHLFIIILDFYPSIMSTVSKETLTKLFIGCHWLAMSNSFANPIIYGFTNESFRADLVTLFYMWFPCCVCLTKMMPRHSSGSTYETVVFRRQSLYKQGAKIGGTYQTRTVNSLRMSKPYLNGHRNRFEYEDIGSGRNSGRNSSVNGRIANGQQAIVRDSDYKRLEGVTPNSDSVNSVASETETLSPAHSNRNSSR